MVAPEARRQVLHYFMVGDPKGKGNYSGQMRVWVHYLKNIPKDQLSNIVDKYIKTHQTVDRAFERTGGTGEGSLAHQLFYNDSFFGKLNDAGKRAFIEADVDDVLYVLKGICRHATCKNCRTYYPDLMKLQPASAERFVCSQCGRPAVETDFPKIVAIAKVIADHRAWFGENLARVQMVLGRQFGLLPV